MEIVLNQIASGYDLSKVNANFQKIQDELNNRVLYRDPSDGEANALEKDIDANGKRIYNLTDPVDNGDAVTKKFLDDNFGTGASVSASAAAASAAAALLSETNAAQSAFNADISADNSQASALLAQSYSTLGLGGAAGFDLGFITDPFILFPTNWGTLT